MVAPPRFKDALEILAKHRVDLVVVGGVAAVLNGAPIATFDLDVVHARGQDNLDRLAAALKELEARYRDPVVVTCVQRPLPWRATVITCC